MFLRVLPGVTRTLPLAALIAAIGCASGDAAPRGAVLGSSPCNLSGAQILGDWARPEVRSLDDRGNVTPVPEWRAELWLPDGSYQHGCRFSCASDFLSAVVTADRAATLIRLTHAAPYARHLGTTGATLSIDGRSPLHQIELSTDRFERHEVDEYVESYLYAFPSTHPPTWEVLEASLEIEGSTDRLRVRFAWPCELELLALARTDLLPPQWSRRALTDRPRRVVVRPARFFG